jgi:ISXO2-like transposase domain/Predicted 3'-5' exonuclease related to the exonuclease domain of PolB
VFCNEVKGKSALALSRDLGLSYKSAFVLLHKLREAMAEEMKGRVVGGEGKQAEIDGGYFGGYVKPANQKEHRRDRRYAHNQNGKRKVVVIVRERGGNSVPAVFGTESAAASFIRARIAKGTLVHADEAASWDGLHKRFEMKRINHQEAYSLDGACTNMAEEYFSRLRRAEIGIHHHIAGAYLLRYAQESSWREDNRRVSNGDQLNRVAALAMKRGKSVDFTVDLPVLRYRAMIHNVFAPGLHNRAYYHRYTEDNVDLCDVLSSFNFGAKVKPDEPDNGPTRETKRDRRVSGRGLLQRWPNSGNC